ncbi:MAG TPA: type III-B CRISPR-associated protein Cas10/Cmr2, partial [Chloroflexia bacterium]|nr:type III-B CRISPR-associated protein Cas10/Cmr2 [Chloroflexia bacterium]
MPHLFLASIGPVQDFIASARRSRDLRFGSRLLSDLAKVAAAKIAAADGANQLIFPALPDAESASDREISVPNKILARVESDPVALGRSIEAAVHAELQRHQEVGYRQVSGTFDQIVAAAQVADLIELVWVALPLDGEYSQTRARLDALLAARKATRNFGPSTWGSAQPKSSLDGQRESVIPEIKYPARGDEQTRQEKIARLYAEYGAGPAERLSGVDLLKRQGNAGADARFPSTSHIAALPLMIGLDRNQGATAKRAWNTYITTLEEALKPLSLARVANEHPLHEILGEYEGDLLFEERLVDLFEGLGPAARKDPRLAQAQKALRAFFDQVGGPAP